MNRRNFIKSASGLLVAAPAIVSAANIMRVKPLGFTQQNVEQAMVAARMVELRRQMDESVIRGYRDLILYGRSVSIDGVYVSLDKVPLFHVGGHA